MGINETGPGGSAGEVLAPLYRRLPYGPKRIRREEVARNQRTRLYGAMIESVHQRGYHATTVAHVIALAGVSRRAFYEQFSNKESCFLATHDILVARERKRVIEAWQRERGWTNRLHASCKTLLDDLAGDPRGPRLVLVESLGVGARARERMHSAAAAFETLLSTVLRLAPGGGSPPALAPKAIVGGVRQVLFVRTLEGRQAELYSLTDEVLDWIEAYRLPAAARLGTTSPAVDRPRPPVAPPAFLQGGGERTRVLASLVELTLRYGYAPLTDPQIAEHAGISTESFRRAFGGREECFLAVIDEFVHEATSCAMDRFDGAGTWPDAVCRAMRAFVEHLVDSRALLRLAFIDLFEVGPGIVGRLTRSIEGFTELLTETGPEPRRGPIIAREAVTGAIWAVIATYVSGNRLSRLPTLVDQLTFIALAPYIGPRAAVEAIRAGVKP